jgi:hypothetical protein
MKFGLSIKLEAIFSPAVPSLHLLHLKTKRKKELGGWLHYCVFFVRIQFCSFGSWILLMPKAILIKRMASSVV